MKKIYISICALAISFSSIAQLSNQSFAVAKGKKSQKTTLMNAEKSAPFWSEDFANGIPTTWTNSNVPWVYRGPATSPNQTTGSQGAYASGGAPILSTSAANGFIIFDSDYYDNGGTQGAFGSGMYPCPHNGELMTEAIDMSPYTDVTLSFNSYYRTFAGQAFVDFYVGGVFTERVQVHANVAVNDGTFTDEIALARVPFSVVGNANVQMSFVFEGSTNSNNGFTGYYFWQIDDLELIETASNLIDIEDVVVGGFWLDYANFSGAGLNGIIGLDYTLTPTSQLANHPYVIEGVLRNLGATDQSSMLKYEVYGAGSYLGSSVATNVTAYSATNTVDSVIVAASPSLNPAVGSYGVAIWGESDSAGVITTISDTTYKAITITDYIYGKDQGLIVNSTGDTTNPGSWILGGSVDQNHVTTRYEMYANEDLTGLRAFIHGNSAVGAQVKAVIYELDTTAADGLIYLDESDNYTITAQDLGAWIDIPFLSPISLFSGYAYEFGVVGFQHPTDSSFIGTSGSMMYAGEHSSFDEFGLSTQSAGTPTWYYLTSTPMVRMNFGPITSSPTFDCDGQGNCADPGNGTGMYPSLSACQSSCITPSWNCIAGNCQDPGNGQGQYPSLSACDNSCVTPTWDCTNNACIDPGNGSGAFTNAAACQDNCTITPTWNCDGLGSCFDPGTGNGLYTSLAGCNTACVTGGTTSWDCDGQGNCYDPGAGVTGVYTTAAGCQAACLGTAINEEISSLLIYPNPAKNTLTIDGDYTSATIYNVVGKVVLTTEYQKTIDVATLGSGIYFIRINTKNASTVKKITIVK